MPLISTLGGSRGSLTRLVARLAGVPLAVALGCASPEAPPGPVVGPQTPVDLSVVDPAVASKIEELTSAAIGEPDNAERRTSLGMAYEAARLYRAAEACYRQAVDLDPADPRWTYQLALAQANLGELDAGLAMLDLMIDMEDSYVPAYLYRGNWLLDLGRDTEAGNAFQRALTLDEQSWAAWIGAARVHLRQDESAAAIEILEKVVRHYRHPYVYQLMGLAYRQQGEFDRAEAALARGRPGPPPGWPDPWSVEKLDYRVGFAAGLERAEQLMARGKQSEAIVLLEELRLQRPDDVALLNNLAVAYRQHGQPEKAFAVLEAGLESRPDYYPFHLNIANRYQAQGDLDRALQHLERAIALNPTLGWAWVQKAQLLTRAGRLEEAASAYGQALEYDMSVPVLLGAGRVEARLGRWRQARALFERAVQTDSSRPMAWLALAESLAWTGEPTRARRAVDRAESSGARADLVAATRAKLVELGSRAP